MSTRAPLRAFLGLDLAWSDANPSGLAVLDSDGVLVEARADLRSDDAIVAWVRAHLAVTTAIGIDMPTIVPNATGIRPCERALAVDFRRAHAAPHPANQGRFGGAGRARAMLDRLASDGVVERLDLPPQTPGRYAFEVFPHAAHVRLFGLATIFKYKKKTRPWPAVLREYARYRDALDALAAADPPLHLPPAFGRDPVPRGYKAVEDALDAVTCAYVAAFAWHWGTVGPQTRVYGDLAAGYIVIPDVPWIAADAARLKDVKAGKSTV